MATKKPKGTVAIVTVPERAFIITDALVSVRASRRLLNDVVVSGLTPVEQKEFTDVTKLLASLALSLSTRISVR